MEHHRQNVTDTYPIELHNIRGLFLEKEYRRCVQACRRVMEIIGDKILDYPVQHAFLELYQGLAYNELARGMHDQSRAKVPAFEQAEQYFQNALRVLPPPECSSHLVKAAESQREESDRRTDSNCSASTRSDSSLPKQSPPPTSPHSSDLAVRSPSHKYSPGTGSSDDDDLESHDSYKQIRTPTRVTHLARSYSSVSLLQVPPPKPPRSCHNLMRPIRMGSPPKPYHHPHQSAANFSYPDRKSPPRYDRPSTAPGRVPPQGLKALRIPDKQGPPEMESSSVSPVSPLLDSDSRTTDSTISPVSPATPTNEFFEARPEKTPQKPGVVDDRQPSSEVVISDHLRALRRQLQTHIELAQRSKQHTREAQQEWIEHQKRMREATIASLATYDQQQFQLAPSSPMIVDYSHSDKENMRPMLKPGFMPRNHIMSQDKRCRIEAGRARKWERKPFQPERYIELAQRAIAELQA